MGLCQEHCGTLEAAKRVMQRYLKDQSVLEPVADAEVVDSDRRRAGVLLLRCSG